MFSLGVSQRGLGAAIVGVGRIPERIRTEARREMGRVVHAVERDLKRTGLTGRAGSHPLFGKTGGAGSALAVRTGRTRNSIVARVIDAPGAIVGVVGSPERHMKIQEEGGNIHGNPYLRIPTREMQTGAGVDRMAGRSARSIANAFLLKSKAGNLWIALRGRGGALVLLYLLKRSVTLRARRVFATSLQRMRPMILSSFRAVAARVAGGR